MINLRQIRNQLLMLSTSILITACGGGSGGDETPLSEVVDTGAKDYSRYAWGINSNIDSSFKTTYTIDDDAHINIEPAWTKTKGNSVKIAVIDEDFDVTHPDIKDKISSTYNAMDDSTNIADSDGDTYFHGLAVAGFIASEYLGVAPDIKLILINIDLESNNLTDIELIKAFDYAQTQGAKVINCSWGGSALSNAVQSKIQDLKTAGITVVFSSGNGDNSGNAINLDDVGQDDPSELSSVIGVGATSVLNDVTSYSNYGSAIDILAPGGSGVDGGNSLLGVLGLDDQGNLGSNTNSDNIAGNSLVNNDYSFTQGTSFASPAVTGVVGLMLAVNPALTATRIRDILITTTQQVGQSNGADYSVGNFDTIRAYGKIDAGAAVQQAEDDL